MAQTTTLMSPPGTMRRRAGGDNASLRGANGNTNATTTVVISPPEHPPLPKIPPLLFPAPPPPPPLGPKTPPLRVPGNDDGGEDKGRKEEQTTTQPQQSRLLSVERALPLQMPPSSVMPRSFSIYEHNVDTTERPLFDLASSGRGDAVGLLRRLSIYPSHLSRLYQKFFSSFSAFSEWSLVQEKLFGTRSKDEFLGYGLHSIPNHDQLGWFPLFQDEHGRHYFERCITYDTRPRTSWDPAASDADIPHSLSAYYRRDQRDRYQFVIRIPRHQTRRVNANSFSSSRSSTSGGGSWASRLDLPQPGETVTLRLCALPFFPFFASVSPRGPADVRSLYEDLSGQMMNTRFVHMALLERSGLYQKCVRAVVVSTDHAIDAVCSVELESLEQTTLFDEIFTPARVLREAWSADIVDMFAFLADQRADARRVMEFCDYLQGYWLHEMAKWSRAKTVVN